MMRSRSYTALAATLPIVFGLGCIDPSVIKSSASTGGSDGQAAQTEAGAKKDAGTVTGEADGSSERLWERPASPTVIV
jgi:hypothetical protein